MAVHTQVYLQMCIPIHLGSHNKGAADRAAPSLSTFATADPVKEPLGINLSHKKSSPLGASTCQIRPSKRSTGEELLLLQTVPGWPEDKTLSATMLESDSLDLAGHCHRDRDSMSPLFGILLATVPPLLGACSHRQQSCFSVDIRQKKTVRTHLD